MTVLAKSDIASYDIAQFIREYGSCMNEIDKQTARDIINGKRKSAYVMIYNDLFYLTVEEEKEDYEQY